MPISSRYRCCKAIRPDDLVISIGLGLLGWVERAAIVSTAFSKTSAAADCADIFAFDFNFQRPAEIGACGQAEDCKPITVGDPDRQLRSRRE